MPFTLTISTAVTMPFVYLRRSFAESISVFSAVTVPAAASYATRPCGKLSTLPSLNFAPAKSNEAISLPMPLYSNAFERSSGSAPTAIKLLPSDGTRVFTSLRFSA